jgi:ABC-2 type transport system permease protein
MVADNLFRSGGLPARVRRNVRLYFLMQAAAVRSGMQYRLNLAIMIAAGAVYQGSGLAFLWVLLHTVPVISGWGLEQIAFLYGLRLLAHALWLVTLHGITEVDTMVINGEIERVLLRPVITLLQVAPNPRSLMQFGDLTVAVVVFGVALTLVDLDWSPATVIFCLFAVIGGALIEASLSLLLAGISVRVLNVAAVRWFLDDSVGMFSSYPLAIFGAGAQRLLTYVVPVAFIAYLPASLLLERTDDLVVPAALAFAGPALGALLFALAYLFWTRQLRHYQGVGH